MRCCDCASRPSGASFSQVTSLVPTGVTPELEHIQVKWAAYLPYAAASKLLLEVLPIDDSISVSSLNRRVRAVGASLEHAPQDPTVATPEAKAVERSAPRPSLTALAFDPAWLSHCDPPRLQGRHVNLVARRACFEGGGTRVYAYVHNQVASAAGRLDQFLAARRVDPNTRETILTDGAGEFEWAPRGCAQPICRILAGFHIAMKFKAAQRSAFGCVAVVGAGLSMLSFGRFQNAGGFASALR